MEALWFISVNLMFITATTLGRRLARKGGGEVKEKFTEESLGKSYKKNCLRKFKKI
jgi:hypothetical protein